MKLRRKLFMSTAALAACAATLTTTTYAWYVSNSQASIGETSGMATGGTEVSGNLLLAQATKNTTNNTWSRDGNYGGSLTSISCLSNPTSGLKPVSKDVEDTKDAQGNTVKGMAPKEGATGWHDKDVKPVAATTAYGEMAFFVQSSKTNLKITYGIANITQNPKKQICHTDKGAPTGVGVNDTFFVDAVKALRVEVFVATNKANKESYTESDLKSHKTFEADAFNDVDLSNGYKVLSNAAAGGNAQTYYKSLLGANSLKDNREQVGGDTLASDLTLTQASVDQLIVIRYWLEGTDTDCFDSCISQSFKFAFKLEFKQESQTSTPSGSGSTPSESSASA